MKQGAICFAILLSVTFAFSIQAQQTDFPVLKDPYLGQKPPGMVPEIFAPGIISTEHHEHSAPTFSPDGSEVYWSTFLNKKPPQLILFMRNLNGIWAAPEITPFSAKHSNGGPFISPDGKYLFFNSTRPIMENNSVNDNQDIWLVEKDKSRWGEPKHLGWKINTNKNESSPSISRNGNLYFLSNREGALCKDDIYLSTIENGKYSEPQNVGTSINTELYEDYPYIAPDESYITEVSLLINC